MPELVSYDVVDDVLLSIASEPGISSEDIASRLWLRVSTVQDIIQLAEHCGAIRRDGAELHLSPTAHSRFIMVLQQLRRICHTCRGRGIEVPSEIAQGEYGELLGRRVSPDRTFNQWAVHPNSVYARVAYLIGDHATRRKRVLFLGDDDFASIGVALYGDPKEVTILDIDRRLVNNVFPSMAAEKNLRLKAREHDLRNALPPGLRAQYDTTFGDPPYALGGIIAWLQRSIEALKPSGRGYLAVPYHDALLQGSATMAEVVGYLYAREFVITDMIHGFHSYEGIDGQQSSMMRFERIQRQFRPREGFYWGEKQEALGADEILNRPKIPIEVVKYIEYLAGSSPEAPGVL